MVKESLSTIKGKYIYEQWENSETKLITGKQNECKELKITHIKNWLSLFRRYMLLITYLACVRRLCNRPFFA